MNADPLLTLRDHRAAQHHESSRRRYWDARRVSARPSDLPADDMHLLASPETAAHFNKLMRAELT